MDAAECAMCGRPTDSHTRNIRFTLPDPVAVTELRDQAPGTWMSHLDATTSVMMQVDGIGAFVRALLPVQLEDGGSVTFGVWLAVHPHALQQISQVWDTAEYMSLVIEASLANSVPPWGLLAAPVRAVVRDRRHTPYCDSSPDETLSRVLSEAWPHETVLAAIEGFA
jgi:hypothetical protein